MSKVLEVSNLTINFGRKKILSNLYFSVEEGCHTSFIGVGASGKTTLLKTLAGIYSSNDSIIFGYGYLNPKRSLKDLKSIGCVFPDVFSFLFDDVYSEFVFPLENLNYSKDDIRLTIKELFDYFDVSYLLDKKTYDLTKEEIAIIQVLLAILHKPVILIMDDPFLMMKKSTRNRITSMLLKYCKDNKITIIMSSTNLEDVLFTKKVHVLEQGEIVMSGNTLDILKEDVLLKKLGLSLPFMVNLSLMLEFYEILDDVYLDMEELVNRLWN